jgi:hypothetical protein
MAKQRPDEERQLYVGLNNEELLVKGDKLAACVARLEDVEKRKKAFSSAIKLEQDTVSGAASLLSDEIEHKRELRPVRCAWSRTSERWECFRVDTGEVIDTAPITMADQQEELRLS